VEIRHNPSDIDKRKGTIELKPVSRSGNPRVSDRVAHRILRQVFGSFRRGRL